MDVYVLVEEAFKAALGQQEAFHGEAMFEL